jgi:diguanylate cyclase (GGDEF)-like protein
LAYLASHDQLTGLPNRFIFLERIRLEMALAQKTLRGFAICFIDVDGLKQINDSFGHAVGDQLIQGLAKDLRCPLRDIDLLARLGGDEFGLLLTDVSSSEDVEQILKRLLEGSLRSERNAPQFDGLSIGVCLFPAIDEDAATLIHLADQAMYQVKIMGGRGYCFSGGVGQDLGPVTRIHIPISHGPNHYSSPFEKRAATSRQKNALGVGVLA